VPSTKTQRWLDLLALLVGNRFPIAVEQIMEGVPAYKTRWKKGTERDRKSVRRMFERDKDELRRMGIPLETRRFRVDGMDETDGYLIPRGDLYLPYLELVAGDLKDPAPPASRHTVGRVLLPEADVRIAVLALRQMLSLPSFPFSPEARSALRKLTFDLDPSLAEVPEGEDPAAGPVRILDRPGGADPEGVLGTVLDALYDRRRLRTRYHSIGRDAVEIRILEPWGLLFQWGAWYLLARDPEGSSENDGPRLFRVDRMEDASPDPMGGSGPDFQVPDGFDVREHAGRRAWELGEGDDEPLRIVVRFLEPASLLAERNRWGDPVDEMAGSERAATGSLRAFEVRRLDPFLRWILSMAGEAWIVGPPEAADALAEMAREVLQLYPEEG
jgi:proteasome accessory factor B